MHLITSNPDGRYFRDLVPGLEARGIDVFIASVMPGSLPTYLTERPERFIALNAPGRRSYASAVRSLAHALRANRIDLLQTHLTDAAVIGAAAGRLAHVPVIMTRHHLDEPALLGSRLTVGIDRILPRLVKRSVVFSQAVKRYMVDVDHAPEDRIDLIYQGFDFEPMLPDPAAVDRVRAELAMDGTFALGCVARLFPTKGHCYLIEALARLRDAIPNVQLYLAGSGDERLALEPARRFGVTDRVHLLGHRDDIPAFMAAVDVVVHPSLTEAFCQTLIEALAAGAPLVATNVAGAPEVITHGWNGRLVNPRRADELEAAIRSLHLDPIGRRALAQNATASVRQRFTVPKMVEQQVCAYELVLTHD
ncbi:MAG: glycosyltransferase family 4 protein [Acidimicrobiia bacterium]